LSNDSTVRKCHITTQTGNVPALNPIYVLFVACAFLRFCLT
jgi:hypothetical protein